MTWQRRRRSLDEIGRLPAIQMRCVAESPARAGLTGGADFAVGAPHLAGVIEKHQTVGPVYIRPA